MCILTRSFQKWHRTRFCCQCCYIVCCLGKSLHHCPSLRVYRRWCRTRYNFCLTPCKAVSGTRHTPLLHPILLWNLGPAVVQTPKYLSSCCKCQNNPANTPTPTTAANIVVKCMQCSLCCCLDLSPEWFVVCMYAGAHDCGTVFLSPE